MKRNFLKKTVSLGISAALIVSASASALAAPAAYTDPLVAIVGESTVKTPLMAAIVPTASSLDFFINPLEIGDAGSQITSKEDIVFVNQSESAVRLDVKIKAIEALTATGALKDSAEDIKDDGTSDDKMIYMELVAAKSAAIASDDDGTNVTFEDIEYNDLEDKGVTVPIGTTESTLTFFLEGATYDDPDVGDVLALADYAESAGTSALAAMRLKGLVNSATPYVADDVKVSVLYTMTALKSSIYEDADLLDLNVLSVAPSFTVAPATAGSITKTSTVVLTFNPGASALTNDDLASATVWLTYNGKLTNIGTWASPTTYFTRSATNGTITILPKTMALLTVGEVEGKIIFADTDKTEVEFSINLE